MVPSRGGPRRFGGHRTGGHKGGLCKRAEFAKAEVGCVPGSGGARTQAKLQWRDIQRAASGRVSPSHLQLRMQSPSSWRPLASSLQDLGP